MQTRKNKNKQTNKQNGELMHHNCTRNKKMSFPWFVRCKMKDERCKMKQKSPLRPAEESQVFTCYIYFLSFNSRSELFLYFNIFLCKRVFESATIRMQSSHRQNLSEDRSPLSFGIEKVVTWSGPTRSLHSTTREDKCARIAVLLLLFLPM